MAEVDLRHTRLYEWHVAAGARMVAFGGWEMPVQYPTGPIAEHNRVRAQPASSISTTWAGFG